MPPPAVTLALPLLWPQVLEVVLVAAVNAAGSVTIADAVVVHKLLSVTVTV